MTELLVEYVVPEDVGVLGQEVGCAPRFWQVRRARRASATADGADLRASRRGLGMTLTDFARAVPMRVTDLLAVELGRMEFVITTAYERAVGRARGLKMKRERVAMGRAKRGPVF
jgi:hypothetical protein